MSVNFGSAANELVLPLVCNDFLSSFPSPDSDIDDWFQNALPDDIVKDFLESVSDDNSTTSYEDSVSVTISPTISNSSFSDPEALNISALIAPYVELSFLAQTYEDWIHGRGERPTRAIKCAVEEETNEENKFRPKYQNNTGTNEIISEITKEKQKRNMCFSHPKVTITDEKRFQCAECEYRTKTKKLLAIHISARHLKIKSYQCKFCHARFTQATPLKNHIRAKHLKVKPNSCPFCTYKSTQKGPMVYHIRAKHTHDLPYKCKCCGKRFPRNDVLKRHNRIEHSI